MFRNLHPSKRAVQTVRNTVVSDCILFDTMEFALDSSRPWSTSIKDSLLPLFESIGTSNYIIFPVEILHSLTTACESLRGCLHMDIASTIERISAIDARDWAESFNRIHMCVTCPGDIEIRIHLCEAHKAATTIFLARVAGFSSKSSLEACHSRLLDHLNCITQDQYLFEASSWPTLIAVVDAKNGGVATMMLERLLLICSILPYHFVRRAVRMLKIVILSEQASGDNTTPQGDWISILRLVIPTV